MTDPGHTAMPPRAVGSTTGPVGAVPAELDRYVEAMVAADELLQRSVVAAVTAAQAWGPNSRPPIDTGRLLGVRAAANELAFLDLWVGRVAGALRDLDRLCAWPACDPFVRASTSQLDAAGPATLAAARDSLAGALTTVENGPGGPRVLRLSVESQLEMSALEWALVAAELNLGDGPLHLVLHGWGASTRHADRAGSSTADLYEQAGLPGATVLVVDWDAGRGAGGADTLADFGRAQQGAVRSGQAVAALLNGVALARPGADVAITAHSLGNVVALEALSGLDDDADLRVDLLMLQAAVPVAVAVGAGDQGRALADSRLAHLTVTVNPRDSALFLYELVGPQALGDEPADSAALAALRSTRQARNLRTEIVAHRSPGGGHLDLAPGPRQPLVTRLSEAMVERQVADGDGRPR